uniref:PDZ domain-containing protein n=1 Tax=Phytophthora ramorum TaxID=164328 RepID=H3H1X0_PHYRM
MASRRVFPLSVEASASSSSVNRSHPPPPKSPVHRTPTGNGSVNDAARPPTGGSVGYVGFDRLMMMRQVNAAAAPPATTSMANAGDEASAAVNHRQRMAAEQQRRLESALMAKEDYSGTVEGQERLQRQEERSRMKEEELLAIRLVEAEKQAARALQREKELEEEKRVKDQYLAKIRAQREQQEKEAKEKEAARKVEMERKMKALKEAADAKARAEFAEKQHALEEEARLAREKHQIEVDSAQMQVEDVLGHAMQQEAIAERERQLQIAAEQEEWRLFQQREQEKQREATQLRRAAMAQQYEQDKQRRIQIHKLQKERAAQQVERREMLSRQRQPQNAVAKLEDKSTPVTTKEEAPIGSDAPKQHVELSPSTAEGHHNDEKTPEVKPTEENLDLNGKLCAESCESVVDAQATELISIGADQGESAISAAEELQLLEDPIPVAEKEVSNEKTEDESAQVECEKLPVSTECSEVARPCEDASNAERIDEVTSKLDRNNSKDHRFEGNESNENKNGEDFDTVPSHTDTANEPSVEISTASSVQHEQKEAIRPVWSISAAREKGFVPFAQVLSVVANSPAMQASLQSGDLLVEFGGIVSSTPKCLMAMAEYVQKHVNKGFPVILLRPAQPTPETHFEELRVSLCPRKWKGKGLLGCQLSPFKWPDEKEVPKPISDSEVSDTVTENSSEGASALVIYDIVSGSIADQAGLVNGDILAGCDHMESINVATLTAVVEHIQAARSACSSVDLEINRWIAEDQCYRSLHIVLSLTADSEPLGFALTSFAEYYNYYPSTEAAVSACEECYYTCLTTALHAAALSGHVSCLQALLTSLQNGDGGGYSATDYLDWRDEDGRTPLFYACYAGQLECVRYLVKTMQTVLHDQPVVNTGVDLYGDTVLHAATSSGDAAVIALLLGSGCVKVDDRNHMRLTCAHVAPNVQTLVFLGEQWEADLLATDSEERMPLAYACLRNDVDSIKYLCSKHPDFVDYADVRGNTPLHVAAWLGLQKASEVLIHFLPSIALYITNEDGQNAADLARSSGMEAVANFLDSVLAAADSNVS